MQEDITISNIEESIRRLERKIKLLELFCLEHKDISFEKLLSVRGFTSFTSLDVRLLDEGIIEEFYNDLLSYYKRRFLNDIFSLKAFSISTLENLKKKWNINDDFVERLISNKVILSFDNHFKINEHLPNFGFIMQFFIGEYLRKNYSIEYLLNVKVKNIRKGGDIDILLKKNLSLFAIEFKESPPNNVSLTDLKLIVDRVKELDPDYFFLILDTTLSIKRNILDNLSNLTSIDVKRLREGIYEVKKDFYVITSKRDLFANLDFVFKRIVL